MIDTATNFARTVGSTASSAIGLTVMGAEYGIRNEGQGNPFFPNPILSASIGLVTNPFAYSRRVAEGTRFTGMFGYRSLLRGIQGTHENITAGGLILPVVQMTGRTMKRLGFHGKWISGAARAREVGIAGIASAMDSGTWTAKEARDALKYITHHRKSIHEFTSMEAWVAGGRKDTRFSRRAFEILEHFRSKKVRRWYGAAGIDINDALRTGNFIVDEVGDKANILLKASKYSKVATFGKGSSWIAGTAGAFAAFNIAYLAISAASKAGGWFIEGAGEALRVGLEYAEAHNQLEFAGRVAPEYDTYGAATERQRAVRAIYGAKVNPQSRLFGNEAAMMHR